MTASCPFCALSPEQLVWKSDLVVAIRDRYPVSPGHTLVITRRHALTYFDATPWEQAEIWRAVAELKGVLDAEFSPAGYNVGFNAHQAAGQTVMHMHVHIIPRYEGDVPDPRGGVRGVIADKQKYGAMPAQAPSTSEPDASANPFAHLPHFVPGEEQHLGVALRQALALATEVDIVAAFVQPAGLEHLVEDLRDALARGARVRLLTGDYMNTTSPDALRRLLTLQSEFAQLYPWFFLGGGHVSFHAKCYLFVRDSHSVAYVGSSNLSERALTSGIEWNLRAITSDNKDEFAALRSRFEQLLRSPDVVPLTREVVERYSQRALIPDGPDPRVPPPPAHVVQREALDALRALRSDEEARAGLVVLATGLGKTYLAALDFKQLGGKRALFIAHRDEILKQALDSWERVFPDKELGLFTGSDKEVTADVLFASVQTLSRKQNLAEFAPDHFDYIVVDEFHHASASTYRKVLGHFTPSFLLGLTATPDRMDGASILELCHDNLVYRAGLLQGITQKLLVPFRYFGVKDEVDFSAIPWRGRWPVEELTAAVATGSRAEQTLREYQKHVPPGRKRTLAFCCSVAHADFMAEFFRDHGIKAVAVHTEATSAPRAESLRQLRKGELEIVCAVDIFNEGLDVPDINVVLMLRPTESPVIFLQQLGRGLRRPEQSDKAYLTIVDFIGNHRSFMVKPQALVALTGLEVPAAAALVALREGGLDLPEGCHVDIETSAIDMLERLSRLSKEDMLVYEYVSLRDSHCRRPTACEVYATGVHMKPVRDRHPTWFDFIKAQGDLTADEERVLKRHGDWFADLMRTNLSRSYKMITLKVMLERDALRGVAAITDIADHAHRLLRDDLVLRQDLAEHDRAERTTEDFPRMWREMPLSKWTEARSTSKPWFALDRESFRFVGQVADEDADCFDEMTGELVDLRLAEYRDRLRSSVNEVLAPMRLRVSHAGGKPILRLDREHQPNLPAEGSDVHVLVDGEPYLFGFRKIAVNQALREPGKPNELGSLLRRWFGPGVGQPGSRHFVSLARHNETWVLVRDDGALQEPKATVLRFPSIPYYADLQVACGAFQGQESGQDRTVQIRVRSEARVTEKRHFVVRASGGSMDGGPTPIRDGDLVLCEWLSVTDPTEVAGKACLLAGYEGQDSSFAVLKVPVNKDGAWWLHSWNDNAKDQPVPPHTQLRAVARFVEVVEEADGPTLWGSYDRADVVGLFGAKNDRSWQVGHRDIEVAGAGHSILFVKLKKPPETPASQRYADRFLSPSEFQWESQASTTPHSKRGRNIVEQQTLKQTIHLFCRYADDQPFLYCGTLQYQRHQGSEPIRVWFKLEHPLPETLWRLWSA